MRRLLGLTVLLTLALTGCAADPPPPGALPTPGWEGPPDPIAAAQRAGLPHADREMLAYHLHSHLDVYLDGQHIAVPKNLGIQLQPKLIAPLHTHDTTGIVHIESAEKVTFTLGQFFILWDKDLRRDRLGPSAIGPDRKLRVFVDGDEVPGDPAAVALTQHAEIVVWLGPAGAKADVPDDFDFPKGT